MSLNIQIWNNRYWCSQIWYVAPVSQRDKRLSRPKGVRSSELSVVHYVLVFPIGASDHAIFMVVTILFRVA